MDVHDQYSGCVARLGGLGADYATQVRSSHSKGQEGREERTDRRGSGLHCIGAAMHGVVADAECQSEDAHAGA